MSTNFGRTPSVRPKPEISVDADGNPEFTGSEYVKIDEDAKHGIFAGATTLTAILGTIRTALGNTASGVTSSLARLNPFVDKIIQTMRKINPTVLVTEVVGLAGTGNYVDLDFTLTGNARQRYKSDNIAVNLATRVITGVSPDNLGFSVQAFEVDVNAGTDNLIEMQDQAGTDFWLMREENGKVRVNDRLSTTADTDTQRHQVDIPRSANNSATLTNLNHTISFDLPTLPQAADGTATLQDDTAVECHFDFTVNDHLSGDAFRDRITLELQHHPATDSDADWDDNTQGFVYWTTVYYQGSSWRLQYEISGNAGAKKLKWRIHPDDLVNLGTRFDMVNHDHYALYYLDNGRAGADNWIDLTASIGTAQWNALTAASGNYTFAFALHPSGRAGGFTEIVAVARLSDGTDVEFDVVNLTNQSPVRYGNIELGDNIDKYKFLTNNFDTRQSHNDLRDLLRSHFDDEYALGFADNRTQSDDFVINSDTDIKGTIKKNGAELKATDVDALPDYSFDVIPLNDAKIVNNCYVVQPEDHGQLLAFNPGASVIFVIFPLTLWNTERQFKASVMLDAAPNGLVRIAVPHFIGRPDNASGNGPSFVKQNNALSRLPTALRYPDNSAAAVNYSGYDYADLWHARDWVGIHMVNSAGWCGVEDKWLERNMNPQNPSGAQILGVTTQAFSVNITNPARNVAVTKFRPEWEADNT